MRYIVGFTEDQRGKDAIALASAIARTQGAQLDVVHVVAGPPPADTVSLTQKAYQELLEQRAGDALGEALAGIPEDVFAEQHVRFADSYAEGLLAAAAEFEATLIVVGAARRGLLKRFTVGSVANALLHSSPIPVALAPSGYQAPLSITRMSCALGTRQGAEALLDVAMDATARRHVPLRLISLVTLDAGSPGEAGRAAAETSSHVDTVLAKAMAGVASRTYVTAVVARGRTIEEAIDNLDWDEREIVLIGSSRLAPRGGIFLGSTANKMLRALPVPMVVVPRGQRTFNEAHPR